MKRGKSVAVIVAAVLVALPLAAPGAEESGVEKQKGSCTAPPTGTTIPGFVPQLT